MNICNRRYIFYSVHFYKKTALFIIQHWKKNFFSLCIFTEKMYFCILSTAENQRLDKDAKNLYI